MAVHSPKSLRVEVEIPDEAFAHHPREPQKLASELRVLWFLEQVRQRRLGFEKAAELAGLPVARFLERMRESQITPFDYDPEELASELSLRRTVLTAAGER